MPRVEIERQQRARLARLRLLEVQEWISKQETAVSDKRAEIETERQATMDAQQAELTRVRGDLDAERTRVMGNIDTHVAQETARIDALVAGVEDEGLRLSLQKLGASILGRRK